MGQLGDSTWSYTNRPLPLPVDIAVTPAGVAEIVCGSKFCCIRTIASDVLCFGDNTFGQLGLGLSSQQLVNSPLPRLTISRNLGYEAVQIAAGAYHACAIR